MGKLGVDRTVTLGAANWTSAPRLVRGHHGTSQMPLGKCLWKVGLYSSIQVLSADQKKSTDFRMAWRYDFNLAIGSDTLVLLYVSLKSCEDELSGVCCRLVYLLLRD